MLAFILSDLFSGTGDWDALRRSLKLDEQGGRLVRNRSTIDH